VSDECHDRKAVKETYMKSFNIDTENNITAFATAKEAEAAGGQAFRSEAALGKLAAAWPANRLVEMWNSIPGFPRVKKFTDRKTAVARIWKAIQNLEGRVGAQAANVAPDTTSAAKQSTSSRKRPKTEQPAQAETSEPKPQGSAAIARRGTKTADVLAMLRHSKGATLRQLMQATGWQAHSVRGFISGTLGKRMRLTVASTKAEDGQRRYSITA
jgi:hypothetical protein